MRCFQKRSLLSPQPAAKQCSCNTFLKITVLELFAIVKYFIFHFHEPRDASADTQASFHSAWISPARSQYSAQKWCACRNCTTYPSTGCILKLSNRSHLKNPVMQSFSSRWQRLLLDTFQMQGSWSCTGEESGWTLEVKLFLSSPCYSMLRVASLLLSYLHWNFYPLSIYFTNTHGFSAHPCLPQLRHPLRCKHDTEV